MQKIIKWLADRGYKCTYLNSMQNRYNSNFLQFRTYQTDDYYISNGMVLRAKEEGRREYFLFENPKAAREWELFRVDNNKGFRQQVHTWSQNDFIEMMEYVGMFPPTDKGSDERCKE